MMHLRFLREWFANCNNGCIELGWTDPGTGKLTQLRRFDLDAIYAASAFALEIKSGRAVIYTFGRRRYRQYR